MNTITFHGKVVTPAKMVLLNVNNEPTPVAVFTVVDIGLPYQKTAPVFMQVNYRKEAASFVYKYLTTNKEVLVVGTLKQNFAKDDSGDRYARYYLVAESVTLLPVFASRDASKKNAEGVEK